MLSVTEVVMFIYPSLELFNSFVIYSRSVELQHKTHKVSRSMGKSYKGGFYTDMFLMTDFGVM